VTGISLPDSRISILVGETAMLNAVVSPQNATERSYTWSSGDSAIASVDQSGKVTAQTVGETTITAKTTDGGKTASCAVTVKPVPAARIALLESAATIPVGNTQRLTAVVSPANATNQNCVWSSSNSAVASVDQNGKVTAHQVGTATITVMTAEGGKTAGCAVTVPAVRVMDVTLSERQRVLAVGGSARLQALVLPAGATDSRYTWSSSDAGIVSVDQNGSIRGLKTGTAVVTVTTGDGMLQDRCTVWVLPLQISRITLSPALVEVGRAAALTVYVEPGDAAEVGLTWTSSNPAIATVDQNGKVTGKAAGVVEITVRSNDAGGTTATARVTVTGTSSGLQGTVAPTSGGGAGDKSFLDGVLDFLDDAKTAVTTFSENLQRFAAWALPIVENLYGNTQSATKMFESALPTEGKLPKAFEEWTAAMQTAGDGNVLAMLIAPLMAIPVIYWGGAIAGYAVTALASSGLYVVLTVLNSIVGEGPPEDPNFVLDGISVDGGMVVYEASDEIGLQAPRAAYGTDTGDALSAPAPRAGNVPMGKVVLVDLVNKPGDKNSYATLHANVTYSNSIPISGSLLSTNNGYTITWTTSPASIVKIDPEKGPSTKITATGVGTAEVSVTLRKGLEFPGQRKTITVQVVDPVAEEFDAVMKDNNTQLYQKPNPSAKIIDYRGKSDKSVKVIGQYTYREPQISQPFPIVPSFPLPTYYYLIETEKSVESGKRWGFVRKNAVEKAPTLIMPVSGASFRNPYDYPYYQSGGRHYGTDMAAPEGAPRGSTIVAVADGTVESIERVIPAAGATMYKLNLQ
jgi:uncharacterized protein YjdB